MTESKEVGDGGDLLGPFAFSHEPGRTFPGLYSFLCLVLFSITQAKGLEQPGKAVFLQQQQQRGILYL